MTLAQSLVRHNTTLPAERRIKFTVFERDESAGFRPQGWGISLHSTLTVLEDHIPAEVYDAICEAQVNPAAGRNEVRGVPYVNLDTGVVEHNVPKSKRLRLRRDQVRLGLTKGLDIQWGKRLVSIAKTAEGTGVVASFEDGTSFVGTHVVGADGAWSGVRRVLAPDTWENRRLPCDAVGTSFYVARDEISKLQNEVDPLYFFGCDPKTNTYCFWSLLEEPGYHFSSPRESAPPPSDDMYKMQLYFSWIPRDREQEQREQVGKSPEEVFREKASTMFPTLRGIVERCMPEDAIVSYVNLVEWPVVAWDNWGGLATLAGDSAHCMSICEFAPVSGSFSCLILSFEERVKKC